MPYELIINIFEYLFNEDTFKLNKLCKDIKQISDSKSFINQIKSRKHPLVFNIIDNYCLKCNLSIYFLHDIEIIRCNHIIFNHYKINFF